MNLLEVKSISKTYGEGDTAVQALKKRKLVFRYRKENLSQSSGNQAPERVRSLI